jgi:hypothetical protein
MLIGAGLSLALALRLACRSWSTWAVVVGCIAGGLGGLLALAAAAGLAVDRRQLRTELRAHGGQLLAAAETLTLAGAALADSRPARELDPLGTARVHAEGLAASLRMRLAPGHPAVAALDAILARLGVDHGVTFAAALSPADEARHLAALTAACEALRREAGRGHQPYRHGAVLLAILAAEVCDAVAGGHLLYAAGLEI